MLRLPVLEKGCHLRGVDIARLVGDLQKFFNNPCIDANLQVDEEFGPKTEEAVREYQRRAGLEADGKVGPNTWGRLISEGFRARPPESSERIQPEGQEEDWPPRPAGAYSPKGYVLFGGEGFAYTPNSRAPGYVEIIPEWIRNNISSVHIPQLVGVEGAPGDGRVLINSHIADQFVALFRVWEESGLSNKVLTWAGSWVPRFVRGRTDKLSNHCFGSAFDINAAWNGFRKEPAAVGKRGSVRDLVPMAWELGFFWGGWYNDGMHFEAYRSMDRSEIASALRKIQTMRKDIE